MSAPAGGASSISVTVRVRPFTIREAAQLTRCDDSPFFLGDGSLAAAPTPKLSQRALRSVIKVVDDRCLVFDPPEDNPVQKFSKSVVPQGKRVKDQTFGFDRVFDENTSQGDVYEATTRTLLDNVLDGYNATVFAYGATGCGKTHTITGTAQQPGIIFMTMQELFERIAETTGDKVTEVSLSYLEIYNETIRDLLVPSTGTGGAKGGLMLREDANQAVSVAGLSSHHPQNVEQVMEMIMRGNECRTMSPTEANATSSRSHAVLQINVAQKDRNADVNEPHTMATLSIIDLAGSERASATKNRGDRLIEGANINRSLLALGSCINALCDPRRRNHVPYRDSKLTRLLKFSLGGNCKTVMIVCVSPSSQHFDETQNTLRYANRAKNIQTKVTRNVYNVNRHVKDFLVKIDEQMAMINELKAQQKEHENIALAKFRKQNEKKQSIAKEGIARIRCAYENSATERQEKINSMIKLRQIGRRISILSAWINAFDELVDSLEMEEPLRSMQAIRKTAHGILVELENGRHHCNQKLSKSTWDRALNSALENGLRQLKEIETGDALDATTLSREVELLKANAERDALVAVNEYDKTGDATTVQVLLRAHFETIACIERLNRMNVDEAVEAATDILNRVLQSCTRATSHVVKPDGSIAPVEVFAPTKSGTPKRRKTAAMPGATMSPLVKSSLAPAAAGAAATPAPALNAALAAAAPHLASTPVPKSSPRRKGGVMVGSSARKGVIITTPRKKRSPVKSRKRVVRWRDDTEDGGALAEFEKTPQKKHSLTPPDADSSSGDLTLPTLSTITKTAIPGISTTDGDGPDSSPLPEPPQTNVGAVEAGSRNNSTSTTMTKNDRFKTGFLSKKSATGSPLGSLTGRQSMRVAGGGNADLQATPLRDLDPSGAQNRLSSIRHDVGNNSDTENQQLSSTDANEKAGSSASSSSTSSMPPPQGPSSSSASASSSSAPTSRMSTSTFPTTKAEALKIRSAIKRASLNNGHGSVGGSNSSSSNGSGSLGAWAAATSSTVASHHRSTTHHPGASSRSTHRRRSPTASSASISNSAHFLAPTVASSSASSASSSSFPSSSSSSSSSSPSFSTLSASSNPTGPSSSPPPPPAIPSTGPAGTGVPPENMFSVGHSRRMPGRKVSGLGNVHAHGNAHTNVNGNGSGDRDSESSTSATAAAAATPPMMTTGTTALGVLSPRTWGAGIHKMSSSSSSSSSGFNKTISGGGSAASSGANNRRMTSNGLGVASVGAGAVFMGRNSMAIAPSSTTTTAAAAAAMAGGKGSWR